MDKCPYCGSSMGLYSKEVAFLNNTSKTRKTNDEERKHQKLNTRDKKETLTNDVPCF